MSPNLILVQAHVTEGNSTIIHNSIRIRLNKHLSGAVEDANLIILTILALYEMLVI